MDTNLALKLPAVRHPSETHCTWSGPGKCLDSKCRYSLLAERQKFDSWAPGEQAELVDALPETCVLTLAERGAHSTDEIATLLGTTRDAVERAEVVALRKLSMSRELRRARWDSR